MADAHAGHATAHLTEDASRRRLTVALALIVGLMAVQVAAGIFAHSLALVSDAAHMLTDAGALVLSLVALRLAARPARGNLTFGLKRAEILSAQVNGAALLVLAALIVYAAIRVEGSFRHLLTDLYAFAGTLVAGLVLVTTGFDRADPIASLAVAALMVWAAYGLLKHSGRVLLEMSPEGLDVVEIGQAIAEHPGVSSVHDLHVWQIATGFPALSAHVLVRPGDDCHGIRRALEMMLGARFALEHTTLQVDHERSHELLSVEPAHPREE